MRFVGRFNIVPNSLLCPQVFKFQRRQAIWEQRTRRISKGDVLCSVLAWKHVLPFENLYLYVCWSAPLRYFLHTLFILLYKGGYLEYTLRYAAFEVGFTLIQ